MKKVLHITAHMGGGVGKVLSGIGAYAANFQNEWEHKFLLLEKPEKTNFLSICRDNNVQVELLRNKEHLIRCIKESDLVEIEWWHHPVMAGFLADFPAISTRIIFWSHISGTFYPYISADFIKFAGTMIFTSPYSFENQYWNDTEKVLIKKNCRMIYSSGGFERIEPVKRPHEGFNVGYIGTQSYAKLNPNFVEYCNAISDIPNIKFTMVGDLSNQYDILKEANKYHIASQMYFVDYVNSVSEEFSKMDVFGYLLNPTHFGTTENVLLEAMAAALPVVCLDQCTEKHLIRHNYTGLLVKNKDEYKNAINYLYNNPKEGRRLGKAARLWVNDNFSIVSTVEKLHTLYNQVIQMDKREYTFSSVLGQKPYQYFLSCLPPELKLDFEKSLNDNTRLPKKLPYILIEKNKSSIQQFSRTYPDDMILKRWKDEL